MKDLRHLLLLLLVTVIMAITPTSMWAAHDEPASNEIWYTTNNSTKILPDMKRWKATITSIKFDKEKRCWVMTFNADVTTIGSRAFHNCSSLHSITLPNTIEKNRRRCF